MEPCLEIYHTYPFGSPQLGPVSTGVVQLVLVLISSLVDWHDVLANSVRLSGLLARHEKKRGDAPGLFMGLNRSYHSLGEELIQMYI